MIDLCVQSSVTNIRNRLLKNMIYGCGRAKLHLFKVMIMASSVRSLNIFGELCL